MLDWFNALIHLRRHSVSLNDGDPGHTNVTFDEAKRWLVMQRSLVRVFCNLGDDTIELENPDALPLVLASKPEVLHLGDKVSLPGSSVAIVCGEKRD